MLLIVTTTLSFVTMTVVIVTMRDYIATMLSFLSQTLHTFLFILPIGDAKQSHLHSSDRRQW